MAKQILVQNVSKTGLGNINSWYASATIDLLNNNGKTDLRVDKVMCQYSGYTSTVGSTVVACIIHLSDENGNYLSGSVSDGTTTDAALTTLLNQWKDNVFMTDFRLFGTGADEQFLNLITLEANTRRILKPGQKLGFTMLIQPLAAETSKAITGFLDSIMWYSAAAQ